jgi:patatin-like phospholipase/acyl hydrolase
MEDNRIKIGNLVDFVAGTSTGSIIGSSILIPDQNYKAKYSASEIVQLYFNFGNTIFKKNFFHNLKTLWGIIGPLYPSKNIDNPLLKQLDHYKLKDLIKPCLFTGYDIDKRKVNIYTNYDKLKKYNNFYIKDIIRGSVAVPSFFSPAYFRNGNDIHTIIDGGIFAGNPSMCAFIETIKTFSTEKTKYDIDNILLISIGNGKTKQKSFNFNKVKKWGKAQWLIPIIDIILTANSEVVNYEMTKLYENNIDNYYRLNPIIKLASSSFKDASKENLILLIKDTNNWIEENKDLLDKLINKIIENNNLIK